MTPSVRHAFAIHSPGPRYGDDALRVPCAIAINTLNQAQLADLVSTCIDTLGANRFGQDFILNRTVLQDVIADNLMLAPLRHCQTYLVLRWDEKYQLRLCSVNSNPLPDGGTIYSLSGFMALVDKLIHTPLSVTSSDVHAQSDTFLQGSPA